MYGRMDGDGDSAMVEKEATTFGLPRAITHGVGIRATFSSPASSPFLPSSVYHSPRLLIVRYGNQVTVVCPE